MLRGDDHDTSISIQNYAGKVVINGGEFKGQVWMQGLSAGSSLVINGGYFSTRIGVQSATQAGVVGSIKGGVFTTSAKEGTAAALIAEDYEFVDNGDETWTVQGK